MKTYIFVSLIVISVGLVTYVYNSGEEKNGVYETKGADNKTAITEIFEKGILKEKVVYYTKDRGAMFQDIRVDNGTMRHQFFLPKNEK